VFDASTKEGRDECRSHAANIIKCISPAVKESKRLAEEAKAVVKQDLTFRKVFEERVREIAAFHRKPLTEWEEAEAIAEAARIAAEEKRLAEIQYLADWDLAVELDELFELRKIKREKEEREFREQCEREEKERIEKETQARVKAELERQEAAALARQEKAIADALAAQQAEANRKARVEAEAIRIEEKAKRIEAERLRREQVDKEIEESLAKQAEAKKQLESMESIKNDDGYPVESNDFRLSMIQAAKNYYQCSNERAEQLLIAEFSK
jgi:hypothetical protein